jgi:hypothetical protein
LCPVVIGKKSNGPSTSVVLGCNAVGANDSVVVGDFANTLKSEGIAIGKCAK